MWPIFATLYVAALTVVRSQPCEFYLSQSQFESGTVRITDSGYYCLSGNIVFNPLPCSNGPNAEGCYFPTDNSLFPGSENLSDGAYALGFFAALTIEANDVTVDLCGFRIAFGLEFYLQQRFGAVIEIASSPFEVGIGPADFGDVFIPAEDVTIKNGVIGLTSHHSIHSNGAVRVTIENIEFVEFEVAAIQLNGFSGATLKNLQIGPSLHGVPLSAYYSNARFALPALRKLIEAQEYGAYPSVSFAGGRTLSLETIEANLEGAMDSVFEVLTGSATAADYAADELFAQGSALFLNAGGLPDGSAVYGIVLNSKGPAVHGFGDSANDDAAHGRDVRISNVNIDGLRLAANEVPALYFDKCADSTATTTTVQKGPFGDVFDLRKVVDVAGVAAIEAHGVDSNSLSAIEYIGNPLADAQIALAIYGEQSEFVEYSFGSAISAELIAWANGGAFPSSCADFVCNGDIMFHQNKGIIGLRMDGIEDAVIVDLTVEDLSNETPLITSACGSYSDAHDGGTPGSLDDAGGMGTDLRGVSIAGGDAMFVESATIQRLDSWYGDAIGLDLLGDAAVDYRACSGFVINDVESATQLTADEYSELIDADRTPFPNNFDECTVRYDEDAQISGTVPSGLEATDCVSYDPSPVVCYAQGPCNSGYMDVTDGNYRWWHCGLGCVGGTYYTDGVCDCACQDAGSCQMVPGYDDFNVYRYVPQIRFFRYFGAVGDYMAAVSALAVMMALAWMVRKCLALQPRPYIGLKMNDDSEVDGNDSEKENL